MTRFIYKVKDDKGRVYCAMLEAEDKKTLRKTLFDRGWYVVDIHPYREKRLFLFLRKKIGLDTLIMFTHQLTSMLEAGVPILHALDIIWRQIEEPSFQIVVSQVRNSLAQGKSLQESFDEFPDVFPVLYRALLGVAEVGANLVKILRKLLEYLVNQREFILKLKRAITYPIFVVGFAISVVIIMLLWVIPTFQMFFRRVNVELPLFTQVIVNISSLMRTFSFWIIMAVVLTVVFILYKKFSATPQGRDKIDRLKLRLPILGKIIYVAAIGRTVRSLGLLVIGGLPIVKSIEVAKETALNTVVANALEQVRKRVIEGNSLSASLKESAIFPPFLVEMVSVGEESGTLVEMLERLAIYFEEDLDFRLGRFLILLEPLLIILVGGVVICILLSIYLPIVRLWGGITGLR